MAEDVFWMLLLLYYIIIYSMMSKQHFHVVVNASGDNVNDFIYSLSVTVTAALYFLG